MALLRNHARQMKRNTHMTSSETRFAIDTYTYFYGIDAQLASPCCFLEPDHYVDA